MGMLLILLGLVAAGVVGDFVAENDLTSAPGERVALLGTSFRLSSAELVLGAAVLGALAVALVILGLGLLRGSWGRRRALKRRIGDLERENVELRSKVHLAAAVGAHPSQEPRPDKDRQG